MDRPSSFKSVKEAVLFMFFHDVIGLAKPVKIKKNTMLRDFSPNKKFEEEYVDMIVDRVERVFNVSIRRIKNKSVEEILKYIELQKQKSALYKF